MNIATTEYRRWETNRPPVDETPYVRPDPPAAAEPPSLGRRAKFLAADGQIPTPLEREALLGTNDLVEASFIDRCRVVMTCVGRLRFLSDGGARSYATGFLIAPGLMMTNHHVLGSERAAAGASIEFGYQFDLAGQLKSGTEFELRPEEFFVSDQSLDFAVVAVAARSTGGVALSDRGYLRLNPESGKVKEQEFVTIVQHPDGLPMRIALRENEVTRARDDEPVVWYRADTAHGSSGAPVFNDSFQIAALHASGRIKRNSRGEYALANGGWAASLDGLGESDVIYEANVGYRVSRICERLLAKAAARSAPHARMLEAAMVGGDVLAAAVDTVSEPDEPDEREGLVDRRGRIDMPETTRTSPPDDRPEAAPSVAPYSVPNGVTVPLQLRISLETPGQAPAARTTNGNGNGHGAVAGLEEGEAFQMRIPVIYDGLDEREGFDPQFLEFPQDRRVPMPRLTVAGEKVAAPLLDGSGSELKYHKFSVWMQKDRRLALMTASNVDWRARKKMVDGTKTDRGTLAGFPPNKTFAEQWVNDPRIAEEHQLPDVFYTEDRGAFDKGHLVRRDDVCWGATFEDIQMGNGDTYHVTNCSPQTKPFNQGPFGEENWGDLESHVQRVTKEEAEKVVIYAGPIFSANDRWFRGKDNTGNARIQIPTKYWKIVVSNANNRPAAYGFVLEQDVRDITEEEFFVTEEWIGRMKRLKDLQKTLRGWVSLDELLQFDQFDAIING